MGIAAALTCALALAPGAHGQPVSDFRLPPATSTPRPAGPVDGENPEVAPSAPVPAPTIAVPRPQPQSTSMPASRPTPQASPPPRPAPTPMPTRAQPAPSTGPASAPTATPGPAQSAQTLEPPLEPAPEPALPPAIPSARPPAPSSAEPVAEPSSRVSWWWWLAATALAGALGTGLAIGLRRRQVGRAAVSDTPPQDERAQPSPPHPQSAPTPAAVPVATPFELALEAVRLSLSLVNATLQYRLRLTNLSHRALGPVTLGADMIAAHASLSEDSQLARDGAPLEPRHRLPGLAPGESIDISGDLRLPLAAITPIRSGSAALLVPLVRLRIESGAICETRVLVVGEGSAEEEGRLRPFRLDHGPRVFSALRQRELAA